MNDDRLKFIALIRAFIDAIETCTDISEDYVTALWDLYGARNNKCNSILIYYDTLGSVINTMMGCFANRISFQTVIKRAVGDGSSKEEEKRHAENWSRGGGVQYNDSVYNGQSLTRGQANAQAYSSSFDVAKRSSNELGYYTDTGKGDSMRQTIADSFSNSAGFNNQASSAQDKYVRTGEGSTCSYAREERFTFGSGIPALVIALSADDTQVTSSKHYKTSDATRYKRDASDVDYRTARNKSDENAKSRVMAFSNFQAVVDNASSNASQGWRVMEMRGSRDSIAYQLGTGYTQGDSKGNAQSNLTGRESLDATRTRDNSYNYDSNVTMTEEKSNQLVQHLKELQSLMLARRKDIATKGKSSPKPVVGQRAFSITSLQNTHRTYVIKTEEVCTCFSNPCIQECHCGLNWGAFVI
ncbi:MAG: hypothetical protein IPL23_24345 [Saprospiraceae bacterium]|nr:hypothetical protein [Saprospiraceae bacterium]